MRKYSFAIKSLKMENSLITAEEMLGLKCPELIVNEVEVETSETPAVAKIQSTSIVRRKGNEKKETPYFEHSDYQNGALFEEQNYCWSQTISEIEIHVRLPPNIRLAKHLDVSITVSSLKVSCRTTGAIILQGDLFEKCKANETMWTITGGDKLNLSLDKQREIWWKRLLKNESDIDISRIDCSRPMEELPEDTRTEIERIQWDEQQKLCGGLTSKQIQQQKMLKEAWGKEGSPFKGMPFDPNVVQFEE